MKGCHEWDIVFFKEIILFLIARSTEFIPIFIKNGKILDLPESSTALSS